MGKLKTDKSREYSTLKKAQRMAEAFAENKYEVFANRFLEESGLKGKVELQESFRQAFGGLIALCYAMGRIDHEQNQTIKTLYVPGDGNTNSTNEPRDESPSQLILPGFE